MTTALPHDNRSDLQHRLQRHPSFRRNRRLVVEQQDNRVVLNGSVPSYYDKQMVQELVRQLDGIEEIINQLTVTGDFEDA